MLVNEFHQLKKNKEKKNTINSVLIKTALVLFFGIYSQSLCNFIIRMNTILPR